MDWTTMSGLYGNIDDYTNQLRALEQHINDNPDDAAAAFVLAYHYLVTGHTDEAIELLKTVVRLKPTDTTAQRLLASLSPPATPPVKDSATAKSATPKIEMPTDSDTPEIDLVGTWLAKPTGAKITLTIDEKSGFTWNAVPEDQPSVELTGNLISTGDRLILETETQGSMVGDVRPLASDQFQFQIPGGPPQDPGLTFIRQP
jgi:tetratricopeptide (TPR) repeat protein